MSGRITMRRVRVERQHHGRDAAFDGAPVHTFDDLHVAPMQPVEVAKGQHRRPPVRRPRIVGKMNDVHGIDHIRG